MGCRPSINYLLVEFHELGIKLFQNSRVERIYSHFQRFVNDRQTGCWKMELKHLFWRILVLYLNPRFEYGFPQHPCLAGCTLIFNRPGTPPTIPLENLGCFSGDGVVAHVTFSVGIEYSAPIPWRSDRQIQEYDLALLLIYKLMLRHFPSVS
jgi:hypothetical protein